MLAPERLSLPLIPLGYFPSSILSLQPDIYNRCMSKKRRRKNAFVKPRHPLSPEPGAWVLQDYAGMPTLDPPAELSEDEVAVREIKDFIEYEGLGFCIYCLIPSERVADNSLRVLWKHAREAMQNIVEYLEEIPDVEPRKGKKRPIQRLERIEPVDLKIFTGGEEVDEQS